MISERLRELERAGIVKREKLPPPASARVYALTDWGRELEETMIAFGRWAARSPSPSDAAVGLDSLVLALKTLFDSDAAKGLRATFGLTLGEDRFRIEVSEDEIDVSRGEADQADATIDTDPDPLAAVLWSGRSLADAKRTREMRIEGDESAVKQLVSLFPLPEPVAA
jgi:alkyl sulfatase BDS1-like metallo-beta-lactamase superfamily hydrolase